MSQVVVVGIGESASGDDGVGPAVIDYLRTDPPSPLMVIRDAAPLVDLVDGTTNVVLVDAIEGSQPGRVRSLRPGQLGDRRAVSTYGLSVSEALELAATLNGADLDAQVRIVAVVVERVEVGAILSEPVRRAVPEAADTVRAHVLELSGA